MSKEVETRTLLDKKDVKRVMNNLPSNGFVQESQVAQHDIVFDKDGEIFRSGSKIRLRIEGGKKELTFKGKSAGDKDASRRAEINLPMGDTADENDVIEFMTAIGFSVLLNLRKTRTEFKREKLSVCLDEYPIIGHVMEIEGDEKEFAEIKQLCAPEYRFGDYRLVEFFETVMQKTGKDIYVLKQEYKNKTGLDLGAIEMLFKQKEEKMEQLSLVIFKPDMFCDCATGGIKHGVKDKFFAALKEHGLEVILTGKKFWFTEKLMQDHYGHVKAYNNGQAIFDNTSAFMLSGESLPMIVWGENAIQTVRNIIGPTRNATTGLRVTSESATKDSPKNYIHASGIANGADPYREAKEEIVRFFPNEYKQLIKDPRYKEFFGA